MIVCDSNCQETTIPCLCSETQRKYSSSSKIRKLHFNAPLVHKRRPHKIDPLVRTASTSISTCPCGHIIIFEKSPQQKLRTSVSTEPPLLSTMDILPSDFEHLLWTPIMNITLSTEWSRALT